MFTTIAQLNQLPSEVYDFTRVIKVNLHQRSPQTACVSVADVKWPKTRFAVADLAAYNQISHTDASFVLAEALEAGTVADLGQGFWRVKT